MVMTVFLRKNSQKKEGEQIFEQLRMQQKDKGRKNTAKEILRYLNSEENCEFL
jgi:hypothetical protein